MSVDLTTRYLGLELKNPIIPSASPLTGDLDSARRLEDAGAAAIVLPSLFEEQIIAEAEELDHYLTQGTESFAEALSYFPAQDEYRLGVDDYLEKLRAMKETLSIPVIASLNGVSSGGWTGYARKMEEAGADAVELNVYFIPTDPGLGGREVEQIYVDVLAEVKRSVGLPVAIKLSPFFSAMSEMAHRLDHVGADGLTLFNRFYQPDIDLQDMAVKPNMLLSTPMAMRLPLRWIAILSGGLEADLAASGGIHNGLDALKVILAGARAAQVASVLLARGPAVVGEMLAEMEAWLQQRDFTGIGQVRGKLSQAAVAEPAAYERALYVQALQTYR